MGHVPLRTPLPHRASLESELTGGEGVLVANPVILDSEIRGVQPLTRLLVRILPPLTIFVLVLVLWQFLVPVFGLRDYQLPVPTTIWQAFLSVHSALLMDGWFTFWSEALRGYLIGSALGFLLAVAAWRFSPFARGVLPYAVVSSSIPIVALAPALVVIAGSDWQSKVVICTVMTVFPMTVNAYRGLRSADPAARELLATYGAAEWATFWKLHLPASSPFVFNALKINTTLAMIGAIVAEYFGSPINGLGLFISNNAGNNEYPDVWAGVLVACVIGIGFFGIVLVAERRFTSWHVSYRGRN